MEKSVAIRGIGVVGRFGNGIDSLHRALLQPDINIKNNYLNVDRKDFPTHSVDTSPLEAFVPKKDLRRIDRYTKMALLASRLALQDSGITVDKQRLGVIVATGYGAAETTFAFLDSFIDDGDEFASPLKFANSVHNAAASHISIMLGHTGPNISVSQFEMSVPSALLTACQWLNEHRTDAVLVGGVDEYCRVLGYCWHREKNKYQIGEGSVFFLLTRKEEHLPKYGLIEDVQMETHPKTETGSSGKSLVIIGLDGYSLPLNDYIKEIGQDNEIACYTELYGSIPIGQAFDIAIAALSIRENTVFKSPLSESELNNINFVTNHKALDSNRIFCLKKGNSGQTGIVTLIK